MNTLKKAYTIGLVVTLSSVLLPISAQSEEIPTRGPIPFATYDKDNNNLVSENEFNTVREERMSTRSAEGRPMRGVAGAPSFSEFDTNGNGQLTREELAAGQNAQMEKRRGMGQGLGMGKGMGMGKNMPTFSEYDLDGDGKLLEKEFDEARAKRISERARQGFQMKNLGKAPSFTDIDINGNGEISSEEFTVHQSEHSLQRRR
jgi:Ca2+-binding EF-hand superfamily protein